MLRRLMPVSLLIITLSSPAAGLNNAQPSDETLQSALRDLQQKKYRQAAALASRLPAGGQRDFISGVAARRLGDREESARAFLRAADSYPLLGDYALFFGAEAQNGQGNRAEALQLIQRLIKKFPESPLIRKAHLLQADLQYDSGNIAESLPLYQQYVEKYPTGTEALRASLRTALCREQLGDLPSAAATLRLLWLNNPASPTATEAEKALSRLKDKGAVTPPYTPQELLKRGSILYDLRKYDLALKTFRSIPADPASELTGRLQLKIGQTLVKIRRLQEAEELLGKLIATSPKPEIAAEAQHWIARSFDKGGRDDEAFAAYQKLAADHPTSDLADDALLDAAFVRKFQGKPADAVTALKNLLATYPKTRLKPRVMWEIAWGSYLAGDLPAAGDALQSLLNSEEYRERALYWLGKTQAARGDQAAARETHANLAKEFPHGYYATYLPEMLTPPSAELRLQGTVNNLLPLVDGYERVRALASFSLIEEARKELAATRKRAGSNGKGLPALARLHLELEDYNGAILLYRNDLPARITRENLPVWGVAYPLAYRDLVITAARENGLPPSLVYAVIRAESAYTPTALSPAGARGLMQLMPATASAMAGDRFDAGTLNNPDVNIPLGARHLKDLIGLYKGDTVAAIAAYNAGAHNVDRWRKRFAPLRTDEFIESIPYGETRDYVKKVLATAARYQLLYAIDRQPESQIAAIQPAAEIRR